MERVQAQEFGGERGHDLHVGHAEKAEGSGQKDQHRRHGSADGVGESAREVADRRRITPGSGDGARHHHQECYPHQVAHPVDHYSGPGVDVLDGPATDQRAQHIAYLPDGRVQGHRVHHVFPWHQVGGQGEPGRHLDRHQAAQDEHNGVHVPDLGQAGQRQKSQGQRHDSVAQDAADQEQLPINPVGQYAAHEGEDQVGDAEKADRQTQRSLLTAEVNDQEADAQELDALAEGLHPDVQKEPPEIPVAKGRECAQPSSGGDSGHRLSAAGLGPCR